MMAGQMDGAATGFTVGKTSLHAACIRKVD
jgi:hypothetical protein